LSEASSFQIRVKRVTITTDGACDPNPGPGGWAAILRFGTAVREISGSVPNATNNRMETRAIIEGLRALREPCEVLVRTDSKIALTWCRGKQFEKEKPRLAKPQAYALHLEYKALAQKHMVTFEWVKGHAGDVDNERADYLAEAACHPGRSEAPIQTQVFRAPMAALQPLPATATAPGLIRLTRENLHELSGSPSKEGFTRRQVELLGFSWPAPKGWLSSLIGKEIEVSHYERVKLAISAKRLQTKLQATIAI
jgi:ribonuclease HI